ncbi:MAG TPA: efflux RND transporter permease subunit [Candidatus Brocadiia bacterium]|nr:efflux RND transporter permease subunit [Candidatus Brocadiia bacterium]
MIISKIAIRRSTTALVLMFCITVAGMYSYATLPRESAPDITIPIVNVTTNYRGVSAQDMETSVTMQLEKKLKGLKDLDEMRSTSSEGMSVVSLKFMPETDVDVALQRVRDKVDQAKGDIPSDADEPTITEINISEFPIMIINIAGDVGMVRLKEIADDLEDRLEAIGGVLDVQVVGGLEREIRVEVDPDRMAAYGIPYAQLLAIVQNENVNVSGGYLDLPDAKFQVRVPGEFVRPEEINNLVVTERDGRPIYLPEVAEIVDGHEDRKTMARVDGRESISLVVQKRAGENIIRINDEAKLIVKEFSRRYSGSDAEPAVTFTISGDTSKEIRLMVSDLENNILSGLLLVMLILPFFMGWRNSVFVATAIPMSMLLTFATLQGMNITLNMVVLFSLVLAVGMLVDNAIVVVENSYRHMQLGEARIDAATSGISEVAWPVITSTLTTVGAFLPLMFWPDIIGEFMWFLPTTVITSLMASLFVALVINPALCGLLMKVKQANGNHEPESAPTGRLGKIRTFARRHRAAMAVAGLGGLAGAGFLLFALPRERTVALAEDNGLAAASFIAMIVTLLLAGPGSKKAFDKAGFVYDRISGFVGNGILITYELILRKAVRYGIAVLAISFGSLIVVIYLYSIYGRGVEFFPDIEPRRAYIDIECAEGTGLEVTDAIARRIEAKLADSIRYPDIKNVITNVGSRGVSFFGGGAGGTHISRVSVDFVDRQYRKGSTRQQTEYMRQDVADIPGAKIFVQKEKEGPPTGKPVTIEVSGDDFDRLHELSLKIQSIIRGTPGLVDLQDDYESGMPELRFEVDRERAALFQLSTNHVAFVIKTAINGYKVSTYRTGNDEYEIRVRMQDRYRKDIQRIQQLLVGDMAGTQIPLSSVAKLTYASGMGTINRLDQKRVITVTGETMKGFRSEEVLKVVQNRLKGFPMPQGYLISFTGEKEDQEETQAFLSKAFVVAVLLIFLILVAQFDSFALPLIIMTSVILSLAGVFLGLLVTRTPFGIIMTGMGVISLAGVVVNNAIVLIDYTQQLRRDGATLEDAVVTAGRVRMRPVFLTASTTVLGLLPMALHVSYDFKTWAWDVNSESSQWWGPMAVAVIFGLALATVLTLVVVPCLYYLIGLWSAKLKGRDPDAPLGM